MLIETLLELTRIDNWMPDAIGNSKDPSPPWRIVIMEVFVYWAGERLLLRCWVWIKNLYFLVAQMTLQIFNTALILNFHRNCSHMISVRFCSYSMVQSAIFKAMRNISLSVGAIFEMLKLIKTNSIPCNFIKYKVILRPTGARIL